MQDAGETTKITGGGAFGATDKVVQHNGAGTVSISGFTVETFGKLYRSCGNCKTMYEVSVPPYKFHALLAEVSRGVQYQIHH